MHDPHDPPDPRCAAIGHEYVSLIAIRCEHTGRVEAHLRSWRDTPDGTEQLDATSLEAGPFDLDLVLEQVVESARAHLNARMGRTGSL